MIKVSVKLMTALTVIRGKYLMCLINRTSVIIHTCVGFTSDHYMNTRIKAAVECVNQPLPGNSERFDEALVDSEGYAGMWRLKRVHGGV